MRTCSECGSSEHRTAKCPFAVSDERLSSIILDGDDPIVELRNRAEQPRLREVLEEFTEVGKWRKHR